MKMTFRIVLWGGLAVFFAVVAVAVFTPVAVWQPENTITAHPYTAEQALGRELFYSNGCNYCHTQYVREVDNGMGPVSTAGTYNYDNPLTLGSERTGPDLANVGRKRSQQWEIDHLRHPRDFSPMSIMPDFTFLTDEQAVAISEYLFYLGDRNAAEFMIISPAAYQTAAMPTLGRGIQATAADAQPQGWPTFIDSGLYEGKQIYVSRCMTCHGCAGNGLGTYAATLVVTPANFKVDPFRTMPDDQWFWHVSEGIQGSVMPPWKESLTEAQRWNVIRYVQEMYAMPFERDPDEGDVPAVYDLTNPLSVTLDTIDAGKRIWTRECAVCHGDAAHGEGIYREGIEAVPPSFDSPADYDPYTDGDYFWRISEGVPWTAMPTWKLLYTPEQRWQLVTYIRTMFTQTVDAPPQPAEADKVVVDSVMEGLTIPSTANYDTGRQQFLIQCAHCHGLAGDGTGWDGAYLNPAPANLQERLVASVPGIMDHYDGVTFGKVTNGMRDTAMPTWGEFLTIDQRWADVMFLKASFTLGTSVGKASVYGDGSVPLNYVRTDPGIFQDEISAITPSDGQPLFEQYCVTCHGTDGQGNGPGTAALASGSPAAFPAGMNTTYVFATIRSGVPDTMMYGFQPILSETEIWNLTGYVVNLTGGDFGG